MAIVGFNFTSIEARAENKKTQGNVDINSAPSIDNITKKDVEFMGMKDVLSFEFTFSTKYTPNIGKITISGEVLYQTDKVKETLDLWKEKKLDPKITTEVLNFVLKRCLTKAITTAEDLRLPTPLTFPVITDEKKE
ncbi:MAG: hypothetical protein NT120_00625 [Candidatus Aenigmarchaeota archaeon]|nr:hypothetical protein [Candidatus Aenigmarchaeota archaeon]